MAKRKMALLHQRLLTKQKIRQKIGLSSSVISGPAEQPNKSSECSRTKINKSTFQNNYTIDHKGKELSSHQQLVHNNSSMARNASIKSALISLNLTESQKSQIYSLNFEPSVAILDKDSAQTNTSNPDLEEPATPPAPGRSTFFPEHSNSLPYKLRYKAYETECTSLKRRSKRVQESRAGPQKVVFEMQEENDNVEAIEKLIMHEQVCTDPVLHSAMMHANRNEGPKSKQLQKI